MKCNRIKNLRLSLIVVLTATATLLTCGCSVSRAQSQSQQTTESTVKAKQPDKMLIGGKYITSVERTPVSPSRNKMRRYHKARKFGDTGTMLRIEQEGIQSMELLPKGTIVTMESPGSIFSMIRLQDGRAGYIENESLVFLSE